ncbi:hypothetical protein [Xanthomonas phaseoli]|uniref:hypothetical protein n=1 Tax=Xanthomonas phaseoli TaxID=1985254 RepID=UPI0012373F41|nr:hypothetical protein [Xanthomonas phaseoli]
MSNSLRARLIRVPAQASMMTEGRETMTKELDNAAETAEAAHGHRSFLKIAAGTSALGLFPGML